MSLVGGTTILLCGAGLLLLVPTVVLLIEVLAGRALGPRLATKAERRRRLAVIVPAHNEAGSIARIVTAIQREIGPDDRIVVVADNCHDDTLELARSAGAEAIRRDDPSRRGKGFALDFGVRHLAADPPDIVVIMDADCEPSPGALGRIAELAADQNRPVQAYYAMEQPDTATSGTLSMAGLAWRVKNWVRASGLHRLGLPCQLTGTGMAFPWAQIAKARLGSSELVEDLVLGLELAREGHAPMYCPDAIVTSTFPANEEGQRSQRARWETGHLNVILHQLPGNLVHALRTRNGALLALLLDAAVPPLALLVLSVIGFTAVGAVYYAITGVALPFFWGLLTGLMLVAAVVVAIKKATGSLNALGSLTAVPAYIAGKIGIYFRAFVRQKLEWVRTKRD